jgi:hypothetical protein
MPANNKTTMKKSNLFQTTFCALSSIALAAVFSGCETTSPQGESSASSAPAGGSHFPVRYLSTDNRTVSIGKSTAADNGWAFKEPHMDKCWLADNFNFKGYDTLYIAPTLSTAKFHDDEVAPHEFTKQNIPLELKRELEARGVFSKVVLNESEIPAGAHALKLENTIIEYTKGGGAARYWVGMYGGGQPAFRVQGVMTDAGKPMFTFEARRSGTSGGARVLGAYMKDEDIQIQDIRSFALDFGDFVGAISGKYTPKN